MVVAGRHVCRRCLALYPVAVLAMVAVLAGRWEGEQAVAWALVALPLPAVVDFVVEHLGRSQPSPRRLVAVSVLLGAGLGAGLARYAAHPTDRLFWGVAVGYSLVCLAALLTGRRTRSRRGGEVERAA